MHLSTSRKSNKINGIFALQDKSTGMNFGLVQRHDVNLTFTITECQTEQAAQIWYQNVHFNLLKKLCDEIRVLIVPSLK